MTKKTNSIVRLEVRAKALLGEGPVWDDKLGLLFWLDIKGKRLHAFSPSKNSSFEIRLPVETSAIAPRYRGGLVAATRDGFAYLSPKTGNITMIADIEGHLTNNRFNDGAVDCYGNFIAGSMDEFESDKSGTVYRLNAAGEVMTLFGGFVVCNGPAFSPDGKVLYFSNSAAREILAFPYEPPDGVLGKPRLFAKVLEVDGYPDGLTVDEDGGVWCAHWDGGHVTRFTPNGKIDRIIQVPAPRVTSCAFGGFDYQTLFITTACYGLDSDQLEKFPLSGSLFSAEVGVNGLALPRFAN